MFIALVLLTSYLSYIDVRTHRISNKSLLLGFFAFSVLACMQGSIVYPKSLLVSVVVAPILLKFKLGAGDVKLLFLFSFFFLPATLLVLLKFLAALSVISMALILIHLLGGGSARSNIAFAPAISGAVIWCALPGVLLPQ